MLFFVSANFSEIIFQIFFFPSGASFYGCLPLGFRYPEILFSGFAAACWMASFFIETNPVFLGDTGQNLEPKRDFKKFPNLLRCYILSCKLCKERLFVFPIVVRIGIAKMHPFLILCNSFSKIISNISLNACK